MGNKLNIAAAVSAVLLFSVTAAEADIVHFEAALKEAPSAAAGKHAKGELVGVLDTDRRALEYTVTYAGLSGPAVGAGFRPVTSDPADPVVVAPAADKTGAIHAIVTLSNAQVGELIAGKWLFDVRTDAAPNGEIQGAVRRTNSY
jgi:hypothetical protein